MKKNIADKRDNKKENNKDNYRNKAKKVKKSKPSNSGHNSDNTFELVGKHPVIESLSAGRKCKKIVLFDNAKSHVKNSIILEIAEKRNIPVHYEDKEHFDEKFPNINHQGVYAVVNEKELLNLDQLLKNAYKKSKNPFFIILDSILYPQNMGAILRTAECAGAHGIIIPKNRTARLGSTVFKISAGAIEYLDIAEVTNISATLKELKKKDFWIAGAAMDGKPFSDIDLTGPLALVVGTEEKGIRPGILKECDHKISIPQKGRIDSLNASVAAGILIYEVLRQRAFDLS